MNASDTPKSVAHTARPAVSTRGGNVIAASPRAQFICPSSTPNAPPVENGSLDEQANPVSNDAGAQSAKEREQALQDRIAGLNGELAALEAESNRTVDRLFQNEIRTASYWESKYSALKQEYIKKTVELEEFGNGLDIIEEENAQWRGEYDSMRRALEDRDSEIRSLRSQIAGLKQWVSTNTKKSDQTSDEEISETVMKLRNSLLNWVLSHFRKSSFVLDRADQAIRDDLSELVPMYEELAVNETRVAFLQSVVSSILSEMVFNEYFVGLPDEQATRLDGFESYLASLGSTEAASKWRAMTLSMLQSEVAPRMQHETYSVIHNVVTRINRILNGITDAKVTNQRDQTLRALVANAIDLSRLLTSQKASFMVIMPKVAPYTAFEFEAEIMDHIGEEEDDDLTAREIRCVTFPGIVKIGDENGKHPQYRNVIAKATVLCCPDWSKVTDTYHFISSSEPDD
ncbi:hypothetical protein GGR50DRAFT_168818 [Xylaria sp. CBS 124048]|nr:hypothetical protein GGR50DRAFT_168818 [Xylaria sp. CBS 124048]